MDTIKCTVDVSVAQTYFSYDPAINCDNIIGEIYRCEGEILCFPELSLFAWPHIPLEIYHQKIREAVKNKGIWCIYGAYASDHNGKLYNEAYVINDSGVLVSTVRKRHLWISEYGVALPGPEELPVIETPFGNIGITICWDGVFAEEIHRLTAGGAEIIFWPTLWNKWDFGFGTIDVLESLPLSLAFENQVFIVLVDTFHSPFGNSTSKTIGMIQYCDPLKRLFYIREPLEPQRATLSLNRRELNGPRSIFNCWQH